jgi:hypothetical protein
MSGLTCAPVLTENMRQVDISIFLSTDIADMVIVRRTYAVLKAVFPGAVIRIALTDGITETFTYGRYEKDLVKVIDTVEHVMRY